MENRYQQLYQLQLKCANQQNVMWQHTQYYIDQQISNIMEGLYQKLNKKLDTLTNQIPNDDTKQTAHTSQLRVIKKLTLHKLI